MGASATDIITYVGVPLAVLGVTPIFWLAFRSFAKKRKIIGDMRRENVKSEYFKTVTTSAELLSGIVEVKAPQYELKVLPRDSETKKYWESFPEPTNIEGYRWSLLPWKEEKIKDVTYRLQYSDQLYLPRARIDFGTLLTFLLDRGANVGGVSNRGFHYLRNNSIRTLVGTKLLFGKDDATVLEIATRSKDDFEGLLPLKIYPERIGETDRDSSQSSPDSLDLKLLQAGIPHHKTQFQAAEPGESIPAMQHDQDEIVCMMSQRCFVCDSAQALLTSPGWTEFFSERNCT